MKESILNKYNRVRPFIGDGDLILFHGTGILSKTIQFCDKSYYNHVGVVIEKLGALYIVDSNESGVQADRLSWRIKKYTKGGDFTIIQSKLDKKWILPHLQELLKNSDEKWIKYDFINGIKEMFNRAFGTSLKIKVDENKDICSDFVSEYAKNLDMVYIKKFNELRIAFPEDYIRYRNVETTNIIN